MNSKLKHIFQQISQSNKENEKENIIKIKENIEEYLYSEQNSSTKIIFNQVFLKEIMKRIDIIRNIEILDLFYSLFSSLVEFNSIKENNCAIIVFNFAKAYINLDGDIKCTRVILNFFLPQGITSSISYNDRFLFLKKHLSSKYDLASEISTFIDNLKKRMKENNLFQYHFNLIVILIQSIMNHQLLSFTLIKEVINNYPNLSQMHNDNLFKLLYRINDNLIREIDQIVGEKNFPVLELINRIRLSNEIKSFIYIYLPKKNNNINNLFNFLSIHLSEIILLIKRLIEINYEFNESFAHQSSLSNLNLTILNFLDSTSIKDDLRWIMRTYGKLYDIFKLIGDGEMEMFYIDKIKTIYEKNCFVGNETLLVYINEYKEIVRSLTLLNDDKKINKKKERIEDKLDYETHKKFLDDIIFILDNICLFEEEDLLNFEILVEKLNNTIDCLLIHFSENEFYNFPLLASVKMILNKIEVLYQKLDYVYQHQILKKTANKKGLYYKILENHQFYNYLKRLICLEKETIIKEEKEIINLFVDISLNSSFKYNDNMVNSLRIRSILLLILIQFDSGEHLVNFLNVFSVKSKEFHIFLLIIDEFLNILYVNNLIHKLLSFIFIEILSIIFKSISINQVFFSKIPNLKDKLENKLLRFIFNFFSYLNINNNDLSITINEIVNCLNKFSSSFTNPDKFLSIVYYTIEQTICLKLVNNLVDNKISFDECNHKILQLIEGIDNKEIKINLRIFLVKLLRDFSYNEVKSLSVKEYLLHLHNTYLHYDNIFTKIINSLEKGFPQKYKSIDESLDKGFISMYKLQKILKKHPSLGSNPFSNDIYVEANLKYYHFEELLRLIEIYNMSFILGDEVLPKKIVYCVLKSNIDCTKIRTFFLLNYNNEVILQNYNKNNVFFNENERSILMTEINKLQGKLNISGDLNDFNNIRDIMIFIEIFHFFSLEKNKGFKKTFPYTKKLKEVFNNIESKKKQHCALSKIEIIIFLRTLYSKLIKYYIYSNFADFLSNSYYFLYQALPSLKAILGSQKLLIRLNNYTSQAISIIKDIIENKEFDGEEVQNKLSHIIFYDDFFLLALTLRMIKKVLLLFLKISKKFGQFDKFTEVINLFYKHNLLYFDFFFTIRINHEIIYNLKGIFNDNLVTVFNKTLKEKNFLIFLNIKYFKSMNHIFNLKQYGKNEVLLQKRSLIFEEYRENSNSSEFIENLVIDEVCFYIRNYVDFIGNTALINNYLHINKEMTSLFIYYYKVYTLISKYLSDRQNLRIDLLNKFYNTCSFLFKNTPQEHIVFIEEIICIQLNLLSQANNKYNFEKYFRESVIPTVLSNNSINEMISLKKGKRFIKFYLINENSYISVDKFRSKLFSNCFNNYEEKSYIKSLLENIIYVSLANQVEISQIKDIIVLYENYINIKNEVVKDLKFSHKFQSVFNMNSIRKSIDISDKISSKRLSDSQEKNSNYISFYRIKDLLVFSLKSEGEAAFNFISPSDYVTLKREFYNNIEKEIIDFQEIKVKDKWYRKLKLVEKNIENFIFLLQRTLINNNIRAILTKIYMKSKNFLDFMVENDILYQINFNSLDDFIFCFINCDKIESLDKIYQENTFKNDIHISLKKFYNEFYLQNKIDWFINEQPYKLFISSELNNFPIENIPILNNFMILRTFDRTRVKPKNFKLKIKEMNEVCYLVNPGEELIKLNNIQKYFLKLNFTNLHEKKNKLSEIDLKEGTTKIIKDICKLYFYCGHSTGKKYFRPNYWKENKIPFPIFLLGCSSVNIKNKFYDTTSILDFISYLYINECPFVCGNLWDVTDRDMDIFAMKFIEKVFLKKNTKSFYDAFFQARKEMNSRFLNRAAMVIYGNDVIINT